ncbi:hypothetical protein [Mesorhizobium sp. KR1-2]|uniref:hypothetical protein n=1 Tax=Mesorhizobium sp. KR1-2 TaxID=3156609 RepID=UPI0032B4568C
MTKSRLLVFTSGLCLSVCCAGFSYAGEAEDALSARNPALAELRGKDANAFAAAAAVIIEQERQLGLEPGSDLPPDTALGGRGMGGAPGREFTTGNPDILWLYNSSPEGMSDLISILKSAGQKPKP